MLYFIFSFLCIAVIVQGDNQLIDSFLKYTTTPLSLLNDIPIDREFEVTID